MALDYTYMFTGSSIFIHSEGKSWLVANSDSKYEKIAALIKEKAPFEKLKEVLDVDEKENLRQWCSDQLKGNKAGISIGESTVVRRVQYIVRSVPSTLVKTTLTMPL